mgnify:CR=1 FL=1|tara:strand:- start:145 stop:474 length:330 start_codon:yes stop_codon:yes gene_type:complete
MRGRYPRKFQITDAKSGVNFKNGKIDLSLYTTHKGAGRQSVLEADLLLSLLGGYNKHGRKFDIVKYVQLREEFYKLISQADEILSEETKAETGLDDWYSKYLNEQLGIK